MLKFMNFVPTKVGPSKLDKVLAYCPDLNDESKEKLCVILDIVKLGKLVGNPPLSPDNFYTLWDMVMPVLTAIQHSLQAEWNTKQYRERIRSSSL